MQQTPVSHFFRDAFRVHQKTPRLSDGRPLTRAMERSRGRGTACVPSTTAWQSFGNTRAHAKVCSSITLLVHLAILPLHAINKQQSCPAEEASRPLPGQLNLGRSVLRGTDSAGGEANNAMLTCKCTFIFCSGGGGGQDAVVRLGSKHLHGHIGRSWMEILPLFHQMRLRGMFSAEPRCISVGTRPHLATVNHLAYSTLLHIPENRLHVLMQASTQLCLASAFQKSFLGLASRANCVLSSHILLSRPLPQCANTTVGCPSCEKYIATRMRAVSYRYIQSKAPEFWMFFERSRCCIFFGFKLWGHARKALASPN